MTFRELYDGHVRFVWRVLLRLGVDPNDIGDAVQDVFVVVHRKLPEFEGRSEITTWLFAICSRVAKDRRRSARSHRLELVDADSLGSAGQLEAGALVDERRARALLHAILERMPEEQRIVFALFELEGMTGDEIAKLLGTPVGTVRSRLRLARDAFQRAVARLQACERETICLSLRSSEVSQ